MAMTDAERQRQRRERLKLLPEKENAAREKHRKEMQKYRQNKSKLPTSHPEKKLVNRRRRQAYKIKQMR